MTSQKLGIIGTQGKQRRVTNRPKSVVGTLTDEHSKYFSISSRSHGQVTKISGIHIDESDLHLLVHARFYSPMAPIFSNNSCVHMSELSHFGMDIQYILISISEFWWARHCCEVNCAKAVSMPSQRSYRRLLVGERNLEVLAAEPLVT